MAKLTVAFLAVLAVLHVGQCRVPGGGSLGQLRGAFGEFGPDGGDSALKDVLLDTAEQKGAGFNKNGFADVDDTNNGHGYQPGTQEPSGDDKEQMSADATGYRNKFLNEELRNKRSTDNNASHIAPDKFITGGRSTGLKQYPWVVHLDVKGHVCGGSLVSSRHVVTAAHCLDFQVNDYEEVKIFLGEYNTQTFPTDCVGRQCIKNFMVHPDKIAIHQQYRDGIFHNDIAMLRLRGSAPNTDYIRPIALPTFNINDHRYEGTPLTITGWGQTEYAQWSPIKLHAQVQLVAPNTCRRYRPVTEGMLCAASRNGQDMCSGDSGGPIMVEHSGNYHLVGLVSFKISKCGSSLPSMYTNVYSYLNWIQNFMRN